jgi:hypothetical protein
MFLYEFWKFILFSGNIKKQNCTRITRAIELILAQDHCLYGAWRVAGHKVTVGRTGWPSPVVKPTEPSHAPGAERARSRTGHRARGALSGTDISGEPGV